MIIAAVGVTLLILLAVDVFATVFSPHGRGGPVNRRQNRAMWALFRGLAGRGEGSRGEGWLAIAGPLLVVATLLIWMLWLVTGFALIYYPWMTTFLVSPGALRSPLLEAFYFSGYTAATLGLGDVVPDVPALRLVTPIQAFGGFALLSASVTYFLAVYRELIRKHALAASIGSYFRDGEVHAVAAGSPGGYDALARWGETVSSTTAAVLLAHFQYPVLHYFRASKPSRALPVQLGHFIDLRRRIREASPSEAVAALSHHPSYLALQDTVEEYVREVESLFVPGEPGPGNASEDAVERAHRRVLEYMLYR